MVSSLEFFRSRAPRALGMGSLIASLMMAGTAGAKQEYNDALHDVLQEQLQAEGRSLPCIPANTCFNCHTTPEGGGGFASPFYAAMASRGYQYTNPATIGDALDALQTDAVDTNKNGVTDYEELAMLTNPNPQNPDWVGTCGGARYGCGAHIAPAFAPRRDPSAVWATFGLLAAAALVLCRRSR